MNGTNSVEVITASLVTCAEVAGDIVPAVYERFFALSDEGRELMGHSDQHMQGRMFEQVIGLLTEEQPFEAEGYLDWELKNHLDAYNATPSMYIAFFDAVILVVREVVGSAWTDRDTAAWHDQVARIMARVNAHAQVQT